MSKPRRLRFFSEYGSTVPLWDEDGELEGQRLESLAISADLLARMFQWSAESLRHDADDDSVDMDAWDERGFHMSQELQEELGPTFKVEYHFTMAGSRERLRPKARVPETYVGKPKRRPRPS